MLEGYQNDLISNVGSLISGSYLRRRPRLRILDSGCDTSGRQLKCLAELTSGEVVGINMAPGFPDSEAAAAAGDRVKLVAMDGTRLTFPDNSFDMVVSANVMEHVSDPKAYVRECSRVLKPGGIAWFETAPCWTGPRGHHIHEDMIAKNCPEETAYRNDGTVIPDWAHLSCDRTEMASILEPRLRRETVEYILHYLYESDDLNRTGWRALRSVFEAEFPFVKISAWNLSSCDPSSKPQDNGEDYCVAGFQVTARKRAPSKLGYGITRRLYWRLRHLGL